MEVPEVSRIWFQILGPQTENARFPNRIRVLMTAVAGLFKNYVTLRGREEGIWLSVKCCDNGRMKVHSGVMSHCRIFNPRSFRVCIYVLYALNYYLLILMDIFSHTTSLFQSSTWMSTCHHPWITSDCGNNIVDNNNTNKN